MRIKWRYLEHIDHRVSHLASPLALRQLLKLIESHLGYPPVPLRPHLHPPGLEDKYYLVQIGQEES